MITSGNKDQETDKKVDRTISFIQEDRIIPPNPWFYARLTARMEREVLPGGSAHRMFGLYRLQPLLIGIVMLLFTAGGAWIGRVISEEEPREATTLLSELPDSDVAAALFQEVGGTFDKQILLMK